MTVSPLKTSGLNLSAWILTALAEGKDTTSIGCSGDAGMSGEREGIKSQTTQAKCRAMTTTKAA